MSNAGAYPIDSTTEVGKLRLLVGDSESVPFDPVVAGQQDYSVWSDAALEVVLATQSDNQLRAAGTLYLQLAAQYAQAERSITTDDLRLDSKGRGASFRAIAQSFFDEATAADSAQAADFFQIVPFGGRRSRNACVRPEGTPHPLNCC